MQLVVSHGPQNVQLGTTYDDGIPCAVGRQCAGAKDLEAGTMGGGDGDRRERLFLINGDTFKCCMIWCGAMLLAPAPARWPRNGALKVHSSAVAAGKRGSTRISRDNSHSFGRPPGRGGDMGPD